MLPENSGQKHPKTKVAKSRFCLQKIELQDQIGGKTHSFDCWSLTLRELGLEHLQSHNVDDDHPNWTER